ncbi:MAG: sodium:proton antiporter, partial [Bacteroidia bacterium]|nr:sodium:proton antiporter [Bacteroidia bacterium]
KLFLPSLVCLLLPLSIMHIRFKGKAERPKENRNQPNTLSTTAKHRNIIFTTGLSVLLMVPVFKTVTHLPPFMGIMIGLGILWIVAEIIQGGESESKRNKFSVAFILRKIDTSSFLFFLGILLTVSALASTGQLTNAAGWMDKNLRDQNIILMSIGVLSSIVDNVPLVAATQGMYSLSLYPQDHYFWEFLAYCAGTGGSILIIGSAAGVAAMGLENINFIWYLKRIGLLAFIGYVAGAITYILLDFLSG